MIVERPNVHAEGRARALAREQQGPVPLTKTAITLMGIGRPAGYADGRFSWTADPEVREIDNVLAGKRSGGIYTGFVCRPDRPRPAKRIDDPLEFASARELRDHYRATRARIIHSCRAAAGKPEEEGRFPSFPPPPPEPSVPRLVYPHVAVVGPTRPSRRPRGMPPRVADVLVEVADRHEIGIAALRSRVRRREFVLARQEAMFILKTRFDLSLPAIGRYLGGRDHTTVLHGVRRHAERLQRAASC